MNKSVNIVAQFLWVCNFSAPWGTLRNMIARWSGITLVSFVQTNCFTNCCVLTYFPHDKWKFLWLITLKHLVLSMLWILLWILIYAWCCPAVLISIYLISYDLEHFFHSLVNCAPCFVKNLLRSFVLVCFISVRIRESYSFERQRVTRECNQQSRVYWAGKPGSSSHTETQVRLGRQDPEPL
jgi:hypothetical protein